MGHDRPVTVDDPRLDDDAADPRDDDDGDDDNNAADDNDAAHERRRRRHPLFRGRPCLGGVGVRRGGPDAVGGLLRVEYLDNLF